MEATKLRISSKTLIPHMWFQSEDLVISGPYPTRHVGEFVSICWGPLISYSCYEINGVIQAHDTEQQWMSLLLRRSNKGVGFLGKSFKIKGCKRKKWMLLWIWIFAFTSVTFLNDTCYSNQSTIHSNSLAIAKGLVIIIDYLNIVFIFNTNTFKLHENY